MRNELEGVPLHWHDRDYVLRILSNVNIEQYWEAVVVASELLSSLTCALYKESDVVCKT